MWAAASAPAPACRADPPRAAATQHSEASQCWSSGEQHATRHQKPPDSSLARNTEDSQGGLRGSEDIRFKRSYLSHRSCRKSRLFPSRRAIKSTAAKRGCRKHENSKPKYDPSCCFGRERSKRKNSFPSNRQTEIVRKKRGTSRITGKESIEMNCRQQMAVCLEKIS